MDEVHLFKALDTAGKESLETLRLAYANSYFQAPPLASPHYLAYPSKLHSWPHKHSLPDVQDYHVECFASLQAGVPNLLDKGVLSVGRAKGLQKNVKQEWTFLDEIPFDFERRTLSVMLRATGKEEAMLITKV